MAKRAGEEGAAVQHMYRGAVGRLRYHTCSGLAMTPGKKAGQGRAGQDRGGSGGTGGW
jgi:hypothetical protein